MRRMALVVILLAMATLAAPAVSPAELRPLMSGWERILALTWGAGQYRGSPVVEGYVENISPYDLTQIRILVESLDQAGTVTAQRVAWVPGDLRGGGHLFFQVPAQPAPAYRVQVFSYDRIESQGGGGTIR
jgi:hypothetical protein